MAKCKKCDGFGLERDPDSPDGWARDAQRNAIICRKEKGGCGGSGETKDQDPSAVAAEPESLPEQRG
jgi:hypothetical protein